MDKKQIFNGLTSWYSIEKRITQNNANILKKLPLLRNMKYVYIMRKIYSEFHINTIHKKQKQGLDTKLKINKMTVYIHEATAPK